MKIKKNLIFLAILCSAINVFSQDTLYFLNNNKAVVQIKIINSFNITYRLLDSTNKRDQIIPKSQVRLIAYANGSFEICSLKKLNISALQNYPMFLKGVEDASKQYKHHGGEIGTFVTTFLTGGILGLIPAIACSSVQPKFVNLGLTKDAPVTNKDYMLGYVYKAKKMKQKKVWQAYGIGVVAAITFVIITSI